MSLLRRSRFGKVIDTQLDLFVDENRALLDDVEARLAAYNRAERDEAEELYGDYVDAVDAAADELAELRDRYAATVDEPEAYVDAFARSVARRISSLARAVEER